MWSTVKVSWVWRCSRNVLYFRNHHYAVRATLVSTEALKNRGMYNEAAMQFIKMMSEVSTVKYLNFLMPENFR